MTGELDLWRETLRKGNTMSGTRRRRLDEFSHRTETAAGFSESSEFRLHSVLSGKWFNRGLLRLGGQRQLGF